jgi:hypothetical protein
MSLAMSILFRIKLKEINAQPTMFTRNFYRSWSNPPHDFSLDLFALVEAVTSKLTVARFDVNFLPRLHGESKWNQNLPGRLKFINRTLVYALKLWLRKI